MTTDSQLEQPRQFGDAANFEDQGLAQFAQVQSDEEAIAIEATLLVEPNIPQEEPIDGAIDSNTSVALSTDSEAKSSLLASIKALLARAHGEIGNTEHPPHSNITKYGKWYGLDGQPWCAMFVSWVFYQEGMPLPFTTKKGFAYCPSGVAAFKKRGQWHTSAPRPGDVVFFNWDGGNVDHVGIVKSVRWFYYHY